MLRILTRRWSDTQPPCCALQGLHLETQAARRADVQTARSQLCDLTRRVRRRSAPDPREPTRRRRRGPARLVRRYARVCRDQWQNGWDDGSRQRFCQALRGTHRCVYHGPNMCGPVRGPWPDDRWRGWWGENPPYHVPVFVLTNHAREPITMKGGTVFHFVTGGIGER